MKKILVIAAALLVSFASFAQEDNRDADGNIQYGPYETNKFWDNWFVGVGGGVNVSIDNIVGMFKGQTPEVGCGLAIDANVGKWIDPCFGIRAGWTGINTKAYDTDYKYHYIHGDFMWNISNQFWGYKETRVYNAVPYLHAGLIIADGRHFGVGAGVLNKFRLGGVVDLTLDLRATAAKAAAIGQTSGGFTEATALLGLSFNLGKNNWTRKATTVAGYAAAVATATAAANAAQAAKDKANAKAAKAAKDNAALSAENQQLKDELAKAAKDNGETLENILNTPIVAYFEIGKAKLSNKELAHVDYAVKTLLANGKNMKFTLSGNADSKTGSKKRNQQLSQQRADYLYKLLTEKYGLDGSQFEVKANGGNDIFDTPELNRAVIIEKQ